MGREIKAALAGGSMSAEAGGQQPSRQPAKLQPLGWIAADHSYC